jgi:hypothetical protein
MTHSFPILSDYTPRGIIGRTSGEWRARTSTTFSIASALGPTDVFANYHGDEHNLGSIGSVAVTIGS